MIRDEADGYVVDTLQRVEIELERSLSQVRNGIRSLEQERQNQAMTSEAASPTEPQPASD